MDFGRYRLKGMLGQGGMAWVFDAHLIGPLGFQKPVAVKVVRQAFDSPEARELLLNEARMASWVRHPNVVDVVDVGDIEGVAFVAMERVEGVALSELLRDGPLRLDDGLEVLLQLAKGLAAIHEVRGPDGALHTVIHRDLKPANVMIDETGRVRLVDFGVAMSSAARDQRIFGTPRYMAPEQALGERLEPATDVFAFGALMVEVLLGRRLWKQKGTEEILRAVLNVEGLLQEGKVLRAVESAVTGCGKVLRGCLRRDPQERFANGRALFEALDALVHARQSGLAQRVRELRGRRTKEAGPLPPELIGRGEALRWLVQRRDEPLRVLTGPLGIGKSALAAVEAHGLRRAGRDVVVVRLRGLSGAEALQAVMQRLDVPVGGGGDGVKRIGVALAARRPVLILDDADHAVDLGPWVESWLKEAPGLSVLVTSRAPIGQGEVFQVQPLSPKRSVELLVTMAPTLGRAEARRRVRQLGGLPLALCLAARSEMDPSTGLLNPDLPKEVELSLKMAWQSLSTDQRPVLAACSVFRGGFTLDDGIAVMVGAGISEPWTVLTELGERGLLRREVGRTGQRLMLDQPLLGLVEARLAMTEDLRGRLLDAHAQHFATMGDDGALVQQLGPRGAEVMARWVDELGNVAVALQRVVETGDGDRACRLGRVLFQARSVGHVAPGLDTLTRRVEDLDASPEWRLRFDLSRLHSEQHPEGDVSRQLQGVVERAEALSETRLIIVAATQLARHLVSVGDWSGSQRYADQAAALAEEHQHRDLLVRAARVQAVLLRRRRRYHPSINLLRWCLGVCRSLADDQYGARVHAVLGLVYMDLGRLDEAIEHLEQSVEALRDSPDQMGRVVQLGNLALVLGRAGHVRRSLDLLREALDTTHRVGALLESDHVRNAMAASLQKLGELDEAEEQALRCVELSRRSEAWALGDLGAVYRARGDLERAWTLMNEAYELAREGQQAHAVIIQINRMDVAVAMGELREATRIGRSLETDEVLESDRVRGALRSLQGVLAQRAGRWDDAERLGAQAVADLEGTDFSVWTTARLRFGHVALKRGRWDEVAALLRQVNAWLVEQRAGPRAPLRLAAEHLHRELKRRRASG